VAAGQTVYGRFYDIPIQFFTQPDVIAAVNQERAALATLKLTVSARATPSLGHREFWLLQQ